MENGQVVCPYHGWTFDTSGSCTKMPSTRLCKGVGVKALKCVEKDGFVWVFPGDGEPPEVGDTSCGDVLSQLKPGRSLLMPTSFTLLHAVAQYYAAPRL
jgi:phenylpropionate dioxygenase-like ring-hydroxylating dioxygenase large terminal subunit